MTERAHTKVGIIGAGPAGLTLALLLHQAGIDCVVLEAREREYVEGRVRAGLLEQNTIDLLHTLEVAERLDREGIDHSGVFLRFQEREIHIDVTELTGRQIMIYGQQEVVKDEIAALLQRDVPVRFGVANTAVTDLETTPRITYRHDGAELELSCDFLAGCDGFHGVCRAAVPAGAITEYEYVYPFSWLGILAHAEPRELMYAWHERGFGLSSMRSPSVSRLYLQVPNDARLEDWPDDRIWDELEVRLGAVNRGEIFERGITPMRSFVATPFSYGRLHLAGDAAHIVPPTGAKGMNLAINDVRLLAAALADHYVSGDDAGLAGYSAHAQQRVWRAEEFSNSMTQMLHDLGAGEFQSRLQLSRLDYLSHSHAAALSLAENYAGLPATATF